MRLVHAAQHHRRDRIGVEHAEIEEERQHEREGTELPPAAMGGGAPGVLERGSHCLPFPSSAGAAVLGTLPLLPAAPAH